MHNSKLLLQSEKGIKMKIYSGHSRTGGSPEGAILIFANSAKEAKRIAYPIILDYFTDEYIDVAVRWLTDSDFLFEEADQDKLKKNIPHVIDNPKSCKECGFWGFKLNDQGICENCLEAQEH